MFAEYRARCEDGRFRLGDVFVWTEGERTIFNLGTQEHWKKKAQLAALSKALEKTVELASSAGIERVGLPRVGAGLGGLDWFRVRQVMERIGQSSSVTLVVFEEFAPAT
jgi:O-acetyl-ADP-ribose deacetylase (regulator of RNase III)